MGVKMIVHGADFSNNSIGKSYYIPKLSALTAFYLGNNLVKNLVTDTEDATLHSTSGGVVVNTGYTSFLGDGQTNYIQTPFTFLEKTNKSSVIIVRKCSTTSNRVIVNHFNGGTMKQPAILGNSSYVMNPGFTSISQTYKSDSLFLTKAIVVDNTPANAVVEVYEPTSGATYKTATATSGSTKYSRTNSFIFGGNPSHEFGASDTVDIAAVMYYDDVLTETEINTAYQYLKQTLMYNFELAIS